MLKVLNGFLVVIALLTLSCGGGRDDDTADDSSNGDSHHSTDDSTKATSSSPTPSAEELLAIVNTTVPGFTPVDPRSTPLGATVVYSSDATTAGGAKVQVLVSLAACDPFICSQLDPEAYASAEAQRNLKSILPTAHIENPDLKWEFGKFDLAPSDTGLFTYALSYMEIKDSSGGTSRISANSFRAWYHDGRTFIGLDVYPQGATSIGSVTELEKTMTKSVAEKAAKDVFAALQPKFAGK